MDKTMTPSETITAGQIGKLQELFGAALRKSGLPSEPTQRVIETQGEPLTKELVAAVRRRVEAVSDIIVRHVTVDRNRTPQQVLDATGRIQFTNRDVVATMPRGEGKKAEVYFFRLGRVVSDEELEEEYARRHLKPADPYTLAAVNEAEPDFADYYPNATHWRYAGEWCYADFDRRNGERGLDVYCPSFEWNAHWWFAGLRK